MAEILQFPGQRLLNAEEQRELSLAREHEYIRLMTEPADSQWNMTIQELREMLPANRKGVRA